MGSHTYLNPYDIKILLCISQPKTHFALALAWKRAVKSKIEAHFPFLVTPYIRTIGFRSCDFQFILDWTMDLMTTLTSSIAQLGQSCFEFSIESVNYFTGHFLIFLRPKFETISLEITNYMVQFCYQYSIALGLLVLDRWKPNDWKLGESQNHGTGTYYIQRKLKLCSSAQGPWAQAKVTPIFCDAATTLEVGKILSDSSHVTLVDHRWLDRRSVWVGLTPCRLL